LLLLQQQLILEKRPLGGLCNLANLEAGPKQRTNHLGPFVSADGRVGDRAPDV
jgi:hypothetical protein